MAIDITANVEFSDEVQMVGFVNLTPHDVVVELPTGERMTFPNSGTVARVSSKAIAGDPIEGIPTVKTEYGAIEGLPAPEEGVVYIVSMLVAAQAMRADVVSPDSGPTAIRNASGQIEAVRGFQRYA